MSGVQVSQSAHIYTFNSKSAPPRPAERLLRESPRASGVVRQLAGHSDGLVEKIGIFPEPHGPSTRTTIPSAVSNLSTPRAQGVCRPSAAQPVLGFSSDVGIPLGDRCIAHDDEV